LARAFTDVRRHRVDLARACSAEEQALHSMPDASPTKSHLAHTTWLLETVILARHGRGDRLFDSGFPYLFISYYEALGPR
ncbi:ergothioneine biosynthesis protein EgtB, partial [Burkholderia pseudomallei]